MSLINQMLQDLEKRGAEESEPMAGRYLQLGSSAMGEPRRFTKWFVVLTLFFFVVAVIILLAGKQIWQAFSPHLKTSNSIVTVNPHVASGLALQAQSSPNVALTRSTKTSEQEAELVAPQMSAGANIPTSASLQLKMSTEVNQALLRQDESLNDALAKIAPRTQPELRNKNEENSKGTGQVLDGRLQANRKQIMPRKDEHLNAVNQVESQESHKQESQKQDSKTNNREDLKSRVSAGKNASSLSVVSNGGPVTMIKEVSVQQRAEGEYRQATVYQQQGRVNEAISALENALKLDQNHAPARQLLIALLIDSKRQEDAIRELRMALSLDPAQINFSMMLARLLVDRAKLNEAIDVLQKSLSIANERPEYVAFLAALQQKTGHHKEAIQLYRQALKRHTQNGIWWMGLGISLQAEMQNQEAIEAYKQAKQQGGLSAELHAFVDQRITQIAK
ncbi:tetratricopeptide repeat protein [Undibacterium fentianense]|uniref:Tetratricopeptide repeat protein n=1 Tax=Undibacterium fentianense TaxID=2828728 RepID=A0A941IGJ6_9BURK|nr:tetratricopeptide repeat protein [Undibacterium fentianense]MBR7800070.1 tetratricopeptide repeat protein [Undibacterium fentianense]